MAGGVYAITNTKNGKKYVGSSCNLAKRKNQHFSDLRNDRHSNIHLQRAYHKYGESDFVWEILEIASDDDLLTCENNWIDKLAVCTSGYNIALKAEAPMRGRKNPNARSFGKGELHDNAVLTDEKVRLIFSLACAGLTQKAIAEEVGCHHSTISLVLRGKIWSHLGLKVSKSRFNNTSGCVGVYKAKNNKWKAEIIVNGVYHGLGYHPTKKEAIHARKKAEVYFGV